jgi:serine/threonine protein kinase
MNDSTDIFITEADFRRRYEYKPSDLLGEGGFAQVYKAFDKQFHEYVALKFYNKGEEGKYDVLHEMKDSRSFSHKNIIRVHDAFVVRFEHAGTHSYIQVGVLEFANGGNLRNFIETNPPENRFIEVLTGILEGLKYLHAEKSIIHRDLSPENILLYVEGNKWVPKISDFGISKKLDLGSIAADHKRSTQLLGKIEYMAPEQFYPEKYGIDGKINTNVDLWAFGVILYELFMHKTPFGDKTDDNPMVGIQSIVTDPVRGIEEIPYPYRRVIERCLVKSAGKRVQDPEELISILMTKDDRPVKKTKKTTPIKEHKKNLIRLKKPGILLVAVIIIIGGYFAFNMLFKAAPEEIASEIENLMEEKNYSAALAVLNKLSNKRRNDPLIYELDKECRIQVAKDSIEACLNNMQFTEAVNYFESLPDDFKSDSGLILLYNQSLILLAKDTLTTLIENRDFKGGKEYYEELNDPVKNNAEVLKMYNKLISNLTIDSLIEEGNRLFERKNYSQARSNFNLVLGEYDPNNSIADSMIRIITAITEPVGHAGKSASLPVGCKEYYAGRNLRIRQSPDPGQIKLMSVCITESQMKITVEIQPGRVTIFYPLSDKAFYITFNNSSQELRLKDIQWELVTNIQHTITKPTPVDLIFSRLPDDVKVFSLLEGKNRKDGVRYWDFKDIQLLK